jgi:PAS domain S-box-containing protein
VKRRQPAPELEPGKAAPADHGEVEEQLRHSEEKYRRIFENIQDIYYEVALDGTILEISPSIEKYAPFRREELIGRGIADFYAEPDGRTSFLQEILETGSVHDFEIQLRDPRGTILTCSITATILPGSGELPPRIVGSMRDISARKKAEETLREREEELSIQYRNLEELNTALKVLLRQREEDRAELQEQVLSNVKTRILPCIEKIKEGKLTPALRTALDTLEERIREILSPFLHRITQTYFDLTPQEIRVADFVRSGRTTKEIADLLCVSAKTVDYHRDNLRRKLGLRNRGEGLRSFLLKLS